jgi:hypothetical protein
MKRAITGAVTTVVFCAFGLSAGTLGPACGPCFRGVDKLDSFLPSSTPTMQTSPRVLFDLQGRSYWLDLFGDNGPTWAHETDRIAAKMEKFTVKSAEKDARLFAMTVKDEGGRFMDVGPIQANFNPAASERIGVPEGVPGELPLLLVGLGLIVAWRKYSPRRVSTKSAN